MDPKQNNDSFGSLSSGGNGPVAGGAGAGSAPVDTGGVSGGATSGGVVGAGAPGAIGTPANGMPVGTVGAGTPAAVGGNTLFPGTVGAGGATGTGGVGTNGVGTGAVGTGATGVDGAGFGSTMGANPVAANPFGQAGANSGQANAIFGQGNTGSAAPIGSATSDVVIGGGAQQKPKKALVIGAIVAVVLIVVGLIVGIMFGRGGGSSDDGQVNTADQKAAFNSYANYVMFGEDSSEDLTEEKMSEYSVYFETLGDNEDAIIKYTLEANKKFGELQSTYSSDNWYEQLALSNMQDYFQVYPSVQVLTLKEISELYTSNGREAVEALIDSRYSVGNYYSDSEDVSGDLLNYFEAASNLGLFQLDIIERARALDCVLADFFLYELKFQMNY